MIKFLLNKIGRDKGLEGFKSQNIKVTYRILNGHELCDSLKTKLLEEVQEVIDADNNKEIIDELADVLEVVDGLCKAYGISRDQLDKVKLERYDSRGGFENGLYIETLEMDEENPGVEHFRKSPDKYPEI